MKEPTKNDKFLFIEGMLYISEPIFNFFEDQGHLIKGPLWNLTCIGLAPLIYN
jgi:hypothetical protein